MNQKYVTRIENYLKDFDLEKTPHNIDVAASSLARVLIYSVNHDEMKKTAEEMIKNLDHHN